MSLMSKFAMSAMVTTLIVGASEFNLDNFVKTKFIRNPMVKIEKITNLGEQEIEGRPDWKAHMFTMKVKFRGREETIPEVLFVNTKANLIAPSLLDMKTGADLRDRISPKMPESFYNKAHLVEGNANAPHKIVVFSDPQCPFCLGYMPGLLKDVKAHPDKFALYYYHMPLLRLHPVSKTLTKVMEYLQQQGKADEAMKMYKLKINPRETNEDKILSEVKKQLGINVTKEQINKPEIEKAVKADMEKASQMMVRGTPTVYFDGKQDMGRHEYKKYISK